MKFVSLALLFLTSVAFAQVPVPPRTTIIKQTTNGPGATVTLDGTKPFTVTPDNTNKITVTQGATTKVFPNSNPLTVLYSGAWPKCPARPANESRVQQCPAGTTGTWTQTHGWTSSPYPTCWVADAWQPTSPPAGACTPVQVNQPPVAAFAYSVQGLQVVFVDQSTDADGTIVSRAWTFGDGGTSAVTNPTHAYATNGSYNVSLTVTDDDGATNTKTQQVTVGTPPPPGQFNIDLSYVNQSSPEFTRFKQYVDRAVGGNFDYGFGAIDAAYAYKLTGQQQYASLAVSLVDQQVTAAEARIAANQNPEVAGDSYLQSGGMIGDLAITYAWCNPTASQKTRWSAYANQTIYNIWHPNDAHWGGRLATWSGWSVNDPLNNYYYSFMKASTWWGLTANPPELRYGTGNTQTLLNYLRNDRWPLLMNAYAQITGGGSLEGSGYGTSHKGLFELYQVWKDSGEGDLANVNTHMTNSLLVWTHSTVPTMDKFAPSGDQSRVSEPIYYDYQRSLELEAYHQTNNASVIGDGGWLLRHLDLQTMQSSFNSRYGLIPVPVAVTLPSALGYRANQTGFTFARTSWTDTASWIQVIMGTYNQSHAHQEQGSFTLYKGNWGPVTSNIWSHSGIQQGSDSNNVVRFNRSGSVVGQSYNRSVDVTSYTQAANGDMHIVGNLTPMYSSGIAWTRTIDFVSGVTTVNDQLMLASGTTGTFQINVPSQPTVSGNVITLPNFRIEVQAPAKPTIAVVRMSTVDSDYGSNAYRVDVGGGTTQYKVVFTPL